MTTTLIEKAKRELLRWYILVALDQIRPQLANEQLLIELVQSSFGEAIDVPQLHRELDYLAERGLVKIDRRRRKWCSRLTWHGIDVVDYTVEVYPGVARPPESD